LTSGFFFDKIQGLQSIAMQDKFLKITGAVYKILDFLPESDPLKNEAKKKTLEILECLTLISDSEGWVSLKSLLSVEREKAIAKLFNNIETLESYLKIGKSQGWIDSLNFLIITKEYNSIKDGINLPVGITKRVAEITVSNDRISQSLVTDKPKELEFQNESKTGHADNKKSLEVQDSLSPKALERQRKIMQVLVEREKAQVADLIKELPKITKRTVRRDLDELLKKGKIVRAGEWNQVFYQIAGGTYNLS